MKKTLTYLLIIIVLVLPSVVAVNSYFAAQNAPASAKNALALQIDDINGNTYRLTKEEKAESMEKLLNYFLGLNSKSTKILALPDSVSGQKCFRVAISTAVKTESYQYFMSTTPSLCYMVAPDGSAYKLNEADAAEFLDSEYAESLYPASTRPVLTLSNEYKPLPGTQVWNYKTYSDSFVTSDSTGHVTEEEQHFDINGGLSVDFDIKPDLCTVKVIDSEGFTLHDGTAEELANLRIDSQIDVSVEISAKWYEESGRAYNGEATYKLSASLMPPASFYVMKTSVDNGEFITISAKRVSDVSKISYKCEPDLGFTPTFYTEGEYAHALLPISFDTAAGTYKITLAYGSTVQEVSLTVAENPRSDAYVDIAADVVAASFSDAAVAEFDTLVDELTATTSEKRLFDGYFPSSPGGARLAKGYGRTIIINGDTAKSYVNMGVDYMLYQGTAVPALNAGTVVYAGSTAFTGNLVVVDHGMGLKTWYWNLGSVSVEKGASVARGDEIGKSGNTGLCGADAGFHAAMSVGDVFVSPYDTWDDGDGGVLMQGVLEPKAE